MVFRPRGHAYGWIVHVRSPRIRRDRNHSPKERRGGRKSEKLQLVFPTPPICASYVSLAEKCATVHPSIPRALASAPNHRGGTRPTLPRPSPGCSSEPISMHKRRPTGSCRPRSAANLGRRHIRRTLAGAGVRTLTLGAATIGAFALSGWAGGLSADAQTIDSYLPTTVDAAVDAADSFRPAERGRTIGPRVSNETDAATIDLDRLRTDAPATPGDGLDDTPVDPAVIADQNVDAVAADAASVPTEASLLAIGTDIELSRDWSAAVEHYESAAEQFPQSVAIYQRLIINRLRADVVRRMSDSSYTEAARQMDVESALDLYVEVLANLETHYVEDIDLSRTIQFGTAGLETALVQPEFVERMMPGTDPDAVAHFHATVHSDTRERSANTRFDLRSTVAMVAQRASRELHLNPTVVALEYVSATMATMDPYTRLLSPHQVEDMFSNIHGNFVGLGVELKNGNGVLNILSVIPGGPADEAGIVAGESIAAVDGINGTDAGTDRLADLLRGVEHSICDVTVRNTDGVDRVMSVPRRRVDVPCVENDHFVDYQNGVAYMRITNFQQSTPTDVEAKLFKLRRQGMRSLVLDLRGNPGGLLPAAVELADRFLDDGTIVTTRGRNVRENAVYVAHRPNTWDLPIAVLIDGDSASASEIFAGAIADHYRGVIVGDRSYGKGSVQGIFRMRSAKFGLCMTTAKFFSPSGQPISKQGVRPTVPVTSSYQSARPTAEGRIAGDDDDAVLQASIRELTRPTSGRSAQLPIR